MTKPNIFDNATGELSQDAFLCWLVKHLNYDSDILMKSVAKDFVASLYNCHFIENPVISDDIGSLIRVETQYKKIDVFFEVMINGNKVKFILEDKTSTSLHGSQLKKYRESISTSEDEKLVCIYYKPDYIHSNEREEVANLENMFSIYDYQKIILFFERNKTTDIIFEDYKSFIINKYGEYSSNGVVDVTDLRNVEYLKYPFCQMDFMRNIFSFCDEKTGGNHGNGTNIGGSSWSSFNYLKKIHIEDGTYSLFFRLDRTKTHGYSISLRLYSHASKSNGDKVDHYYKLCSTLDTKSINKTFGELSVSGSNYSKPANSMRLLNIPIKNNDEFIELRSVVAHVYGTVDILISNGV